MSGMPEAIWLLGALAIAAAGMLVGIALWNPK